MIAQKTHYANLEQLGREYRMGLCTEAVLKDVWNEVFTIADGQLNIPAGLAGRLATAAERAVAAEVRRSLCSKTA
jgi:hypothetical protein